MSVSAFCLCFLSLLSVLISFVFNHMIISSSVECALLAVVLFFLVGSVLLRFLLKSRAPSDPLFYVYAINALLSVINLIIGLEQDGIIDGFMTFYLKQADPNINSAHGHMTSYWNGCAHYLMYLLMITAITWGESYRAIGLNWVGSFLMQITVYIPASIVGKYGCELSWLFLLHMLYVCVSIWACFRVFSQPATWSSNLTDVESEQKTCVLQRPADLIFILGIITATAFSIFRGLVALDCHADVCKNYMINFEPYIKDPSAFPMVQMLVNMLYSTPCFVMMLYGLLVPGCDWLPDLSLVHAGAVAQAQFCYTGAALHTRTPFAHRPPAEHLLLFLTFNFLYALLPQALTYRCITRPAFFTKHTHTHTLHKQSLHTELT